MTRQKTLIRIIYYAVKAKTTNSVSCIIVHSIKAIILKVAKINNY